LPATELGRKELAGRSMCQCKLRLVEPADRGLAIAEHLLGPCVDGSDSVKAIAQVRRETTPGGSDPGESATADVQQLGNVLVGESGGALETI
jgi:hypothetical protein